MHNRRAGGERLSRACVHLLEGCRVATRDLESVLESCRAAAQVVSRLERVAPEERENEREGEQQVHTREGRDSQPVRKEIAAQCLQTGAASRLSRCRRRGRGRGCRIAAALPPQLQLIGWSAAAATFSDHLYVKVDFGTDVQAGKTPSSSPSSEKFYCHRDTQKG